MAGLVLPDADAFGIIAIGAERGCAACADPLVATLVALFLFLKALFECFHELFEAAHGFDLVHLFLGEEFLRHLAQPFLRNVLHIDSVLHRIKTLEDVAEHAVELVEIALVFDQRRAR